MEIGKTWSRKCSIMSNVVWFCPLVSGQLVKILVFWLVVDVDLKILGLIGAIWGSEKIRTGKTHNKRVVMW